MTKKAEATFTTNISKAVRDRNWFIYKIPDTLGMSFTPSKPFDCFISVDGQLGGLEIKYADMDPSKDRKGNPKKGRSSIGLDDLRANQHEALKEVSAKGGLSFVWYEVKIDGEYRFYSFTYEHFIWLCEKYGPKGTTIPREVLKGLDHTKREIGRLGKPTYSLVYFKSRWDDLSSML